MEGPSSESREASGESRAASGEKLETSGEKLAPNERPGPCDSAAAKKRCRPGTKPHRPHTHLYPRISQSQVASHNSQLASPLHSRHSLLATRLSALLTRYSPLATRFSGWHPILDRLPNRIPDRRQLQPRLDRLFAVEDAVGPRSGCRPTHEFVFGIEELELAIGDPGLADQLDNFRGGNAAGVGQVVEYQTAVASRNSQSRRRQTQADSTDCFPPPEASRTASPSKDNCEANQRWRTGSAIARCSTGRHPPGSPHQAPWYPNRNCSCSDERKSSADPLR